MSDVERRGVEAALILDNEEYKRANETYRTALIDALLACDKKDDVGRYKIQVALDVLNHVRNHLQAVLSAADMKKQADKKAQELQEKRVVRLW